MYSCFFILSHTSHISQTKIVNVLALLNKCCMKQCSCYHKSIDDIYDQVQKNLQKKLTPINENKKMNFLNNNNNNNYSNNNNEIYGRPLNFGQKPASNLKKKWDTYRMIKTERKCWLCAVGFQKRYDGDCHIPKKHANERSK